MLKNLWKQETLSKLTTIESELRFRKAMLLGGAGDPDPETAGLTTWLDDAIMLVGHLIDDLRDL